MKRMMISVVRRASFALAGAALALAPVPSALGQLPQRLSQAAASTPAVAISGTASRHTTGAQSMGALAGTTQLTRMSLVLQPTDEQKLALQQLLQDQQNPASSSYHQWLSAAQFGARFGISDADLSTIQSWLTSRGLQIVEVPASRNAIVFSGTSSAAESAFGVSLKRYSRNGQQFFANSNDITLPSGFAGIVGAVRGLSNYRLPVPQARKVLTSALASPMYTTTKGTHDLVPWDFRQIYGMNTLVNQGYDGTGVTITVIGQSAVNTTQIGYFQTLTGQTQKTPTLTLMPNTGTSTFYTGDEGESEIDIEYAGGTAPGASINFVYTGNGNYGVFDALVYAIQNKLSQIVSMSYGECENEAASDAATLEPYFQEANAQGQTVVISSGDSGSASCDPPSTSSATTFTVASEGVAVSYPASSPYVTGTGGTQLNGDSSTYWQSTNNSFGGSAIGYIPEIAWNDTAAASGVVSSSGGGYSVLFGKPSWQAGTGVPADGHRDVPDVAFSSSDYQHGYQYCSAETTTTNGTATTPEACTTSSFSSFVVGGTSLAAPNFSAMLAVVEQANKSTGLGNINARLYSIAAGSSASSVFNDVTSGNNIVPCTGATTGCSSTTSSTQGTMGYTAGVGYDEVTGLGSVNAPALQTALLAASAVTPVTPTVSLSSSSTALPPNTAVTFTSYVTAPSGTTVPTGTVTFAVDGATVGSAVTLSSGKATYSYSGFVAAGSHTITASYSGDGAYTSGTASLVVVAGAITLTANPTTVTVTAGNSGTTSLTVASVGLTGPVSFTATDTTGTLTIGCYDLSNVSVAAGSSASATMTFYTSSAACASSTVRKVASVAKTASSRDDNAGRRGVAMIALSAGLLCCLGMRRRTRLAGLFAAVLLSVALLSAGGCSSSGLGSTSTSTSSSSTTAKGTYAIQMTAASTANSAISSSTTVTLVVQ